MDKLRPYYFGPIYGDFKVNGSLVEDERIKFEIYDSSNDGKASIMIKYFVGDLFVEPVLDCPDNQ